MNCLAMLVPSGFLLSADAFDINTKLDISEKNITQPKTKTFIYRKKLLM